VRDIIKTGFNEMGYDDVDWMYLAVVGSCQNGDGPWSFVNSISLANCNLSSKISPFHGVATLFLRRHCSVLRRALRTHLLVAGERLFNCYCDQATDCQTRNCGSNPGRGSVFFLFDSHVTVHRDKFLIIKPTRCTNFSNLFLD